MHKIIILQVSNQYNPEIQNIVDIKYGIKYHLNLFIEFKPYIQLIKNSAAKTVWKVGYSVTEKAVKNKSKEAGILHFGISKNK